jgi:hypothetical protein
MTLQEFSIVLSCKTVFVFLNNYCADKFKKQQQKSRSFYYYLIIILFGFSTLTEKQVFFKAIKKKEKRTKEF